MASVNPFLPLISLEEVYEHRGQNGIRWCILGGLVYDITEFMPRHPGGAKILASTRPEAFDLEFNRMHCYVNYRFILRDKVVGRFDQKGSLFKVFK